MSEQSIGAMIDELKNMSITGVGVAARVTLAAHALNNEGSRNNALIPRQVDVVTDGDVVQSNAVSGDTIKHTFVDHLRRVAQDAQASPAGSNLPICEACARGNPNRLNDVEAFQKIAKDRANNDAAVLTELIQRCVIDDVAGLLVTQGNRNAARRSAAQFGWELGVPDHVRTGRYMHLKLVPGAATADSVEGSNLGQNLFTRPASTGDYAFVGQIDLARVGVNDITWKSAISETARGYRQAAALEALFWTLAIPEGAQRNTQLPHLVAASGAVSIATSTLPPVLFSPLAPDFVEHMRAIAGAFSQDGSRVLVVPFGTIGELGQILQSLAEYVRPTEMTAAE